MTAINKLRRNSLTLDANEIHLWSATLSDHSPESLKRVLSQDEAWRADRFHFAKNRNHYIVARGILRTLLGAYLHIDPGQLRFDYGGLGKPSLAADHRSPVNFNLAHSEGLAIYAFSKDREVGVDIEYIKKDFPGHEIAKRFFSPQEVVDLRNVPEDLRTEAFFNCWTRKEAYIKARGKGLSMPLNQFDVSLVPGTPAALLKNHQDSREICRWSMHSVPVASGYVAALVAEGRECQLKIFDF